MYPREFVCQDCGTGIISFDTLNAANDDDVCMICAFIRTLPLEDQKEMRQRLGVSREDGK